jgi:hypothetical protein
MYQTAYNFCKSRCIELGIDSSHDEKHMARVADMALELNKRCGRSVSQKESNVMILAAFTHDLCDRKYIDPDSGVLTIRDWLRSVTTREECDAVIQIITTMSYSKVSKHGYPNDLGPWELAYHHVRVADLIDAYDIKRCYDYQTHAYPSMEEGEKWRAVVELFERRVLTQKDMYILPVCPYAADIVEPLDIEARQAVAEAKLHTSYF